MDQNNVYQSNTNQNNMYQNNMNPYFYSPTSHVESEEQKRVRSIIFSKMIGPTLIYAILFTFFLYKNFSGITMPFFALSSIIYSFYCLKIYNISIKPGSYLYAAAILLLGVSSCLTGSIPIITFNAIGICLLLLCMLLHNFFNDKHWNLAKYTGAIFMSIFGAIGEIPSPFIDLSAYEKNKSKKSQGLYVLIGIGIAIPLLLIIVALLYYADIVFADVINRLFKNINIFNIVGVIFMFAFAFMSAYCGFRYIGKRMISEEVKDYRNFNAIIAITVLGLISVIYLLFSGIQILYLFIGNMELPDGYTYATYVHEGFFQLVVVCLLNVAIVLFTMNYFKENWAVKILLTIISFCTYIMLFSSAMRMYLYVSNYSLTVLRVFVFWLIGVLGILLIGILIQIYVKDFPLFRYGLFVICICYLALSFCHMDYWIAKYNLEYVSYTDSSIDYDYLTELSSDAASILAEHDGYWTNTYAYSQIKYADEGIRKFNFSHYNAVSVFSSFIEKHKDSYCVSLSCYSDNDTTLDSELIDNIVCSCDNSELYLDTLSLNPEPIGDPATGKIQYIVYIPKDFYKNDRNNRMNISYTINYKSSETITTDTCDFYPEDNKVHQIKLDSGDSDYCSIFLAN